MAVRVGLEVLLDADRVAVSGNEAAISTRGV
jgi:hypothetical protein